MASLREGRLRRIAAKTVVTGALVAAPLIGLSATANAYPNHQPGPPQPTYPQAPPCSYYRCQPQWNAPPPNQWHHGYYPPPGYRDDPRAPSYPFGGYPPDIWWQILQSLGLA